MSLLSDMGPSIFAATIAAAASAMVVGIVLNGDGVGAEVGNGNERLFHSSHVHIVTHTISCPVWKKII